MKLEIDEARWTSDTHFRHTNVVKFDNSPHWSHEAKALTNKLPHLPKHSDEYNQVLRQERDQLVKDSIRQDEAIIENWNKVVQPDQLVFHLGDFTFSNDPKTIHSILDRLNGRIILINGNHEKPVHNNHDIKKRFYRIYDYLEVFVKDQRICLFHYPIYEWNQCHRGAWMLHGHTHVKDTYDKQFKICNVGTMNWNYFPVSYQQLQIFMASKNNKFHH